MNLDKYIMELSPELQEKARQCGSIDELIALAEKENVVLPDEAMQAIAGGDKHRLKHCGKVSCPKCGSTNISIVKVYGSEKLCRCNDCGNKFYAFIER